MQRRNLILYLAIGVFALVAASCNLIASSKIGDITSALGPEARPSHYSGHFGNFRYKLSQLPPAAKLYRLMQGQVARTTYRGSSQSPYIILFAQGGPSVKLNDFEYPEIYQALAEPRDWQVAVVHQQQTYEPEVLRSRELKITEAMKISAWSTAALFKVAKYWREQGKQVYIVTHSYGSFIAPKMLLDWKYEDYVEKVLILAGRLRIQEAVYISFSNGNARGFVKDDSQGDGQEDLFRKVGRETGITRHFIKQHLDSGEFTLPAGVTPEQYYYQERNARRLQATLGHINYVQAMRDNQVPLGKVMWITGKQDAAVGYFNQGEINFAKSKAKLYESDSGHGVESPTDIKEAVKFLQG